MEASKSVLMLPFIVEAFTVKLEFLLISIFTLPLTVLAEILPFKSPLTCRLILPFTVLRFVDEKEPSNMIFPLTVFELMVLNLPIISILPFTDSNFA